MLSDSLSALQAAKAKVAELEVQIATERRKALAALPGQFGFDSVADFIAAVRDAAGAPQRSRRGRITDEVRAGVLERLRRNEPAAAIARAVGISLPSVQNIKKAAGLVKARKGM